MTLVRVLIVAACLPLLLPTGFCLCKLGIAHHPEPLLAGDSHPNSDDDHAPGCPGSHGADQLKWIEPLEFSILSEPPTELLMLLPLSAYVAFVILLIIFASWLSDRISRETKTHDHPGMCIDEFVGFFVTMIAAPAGWIWILAGFLLFRLFDIWTKYC